MQFNIKTVPSSSSLTETGQSNPIRFCFVKREDTTLTPESPWFKCKDYFNDVVAAKNGLFFVQYGFDNSKLSAKDEQGAWLLLKEIKYKEEFKKSLQAVQHEEHPVLVEDIDDKPTMLLIYIPEFYFENTYKISLLTFLIRLCNEIGSPTIFTGFEQALRSSNCVMSNMFYQRHIDRIVKDGWKAPVEGYWWWCGNMYNSKTTWYPEHSRTVHNCGVKSWFMYA